MLNKAKINLQSHTEQRKAHPAFDIPVVILQLCLLHLKHHTSHKADQEHAYEY